MHMLFTLRDAVELLCCGKLCTSLDVAARNQLSAHDAQLGFQILTTHEKYFRLLSTTAYLSRFKVSQCYFHHLCNCLCILNSIHLSYFAAVVADVGVRSNGLLISICEVQMTFVTRLYHLCSQTDSSWSPKTVAIGCISAKVGALMNHGASYLDLSK